MTTSDYINQLVPCAVCASPTKIKNLFTLDYKSGLDQEVCVNCAHPYHTTKHGSCRLCHPIKGGN